jgi:protein-S-isoprenylcysteine O-methyltransferase Ste14
MRSTITISRYQKLFGVGHIALLIGLFIFGLLWLLDRTLDHVEILHQPKPVKAMGWILLAIWICWHIWCVKAINLWWRHDQLCTTGPYRLVRHPIYAGGIWLGSLGVALMFNSWIVILQPVVSYVVLSLLVRKEESMMTAVFGEEYRRYASRTGRLFPRFF